jgi:hypothetical protein
VRTATTPPAKHFEPGQTGMLLGYGYQTWIVPGKPGQEHQFALRGRDPKCSYLGSRAFAGCALPARNVAPMPRHIGSRDVPV